MKHSRIDDVMRSRPVRWALLLALATQVHCTQSHDPVRVVKTDARGVLVDVGEAKGNIVPVAYLSASHLHEPPLPGAPPQRLVGWMPSVEEVRNFEQRLEPKLKKVMQARRPAAWEAEVRAIRYTYLRQYYGVMQKGRRILHVELMDSSVPPAKPDGDESWRVFHMDGFDLGTAWIWFDYDVQTHEFVGYGDTGEA
jgi:hypothetical protein